MRDLWIHIFWKNLWRRRQWTQLLLLLSLFLAAETADHYKSSTFTTPERIGCWIMNISSVCTNFFLGGGGNWGRYFKWWRFRRPSLMQYLEMCSLTTRGGDVTYAKWVNVSLPSLFFIFLRSRNPWQPSKKQSGHRTRGREEGSHWEAPDSEALQETYVHTLFLIGNWKYPHWHLN